MKEPLCHHCRWTHAVPLPRWECDCGCLFDAFAHGGVCPCCGKPVAAVQCPQCAIIKPYDWWTGLAGLQAEVMVIAFAAGLTPICELQERAAAWLSDPDRYFRLYPECQSVYLRLRSEEILTDEGLHALIAQIARGTGFSLYNPVRGVGLMPLKPVIRLLGAELTARSVPKEGITNEGITDEYKVSIGGGYSCSFYHFLASNEY